MNSNWPKLHPGKGRDKKDGFESGKIFNTRKCISWFDICIWVIEDFGIIFNYKMYKCMQLFVICFNPIFQLG